MLQKYKDFIFDSNLKFCVGHFFILKIEKRRDMIMKFLYQNLPKLYKNWCASSSVHMLTETIFFLFYWLAFKWGKTNLIESFKKKMKLFIIGIISLISQLQQNFRYFCIKFSWHHNPLTTWTCPWSNKLRSTPHLPLWDKSFDVIEAIVHIFTNSDRFSSNYLKFLTLHVSRRHHRHSLL